MGYLERSTWEEMTLPGGRYACAQELMNRRLPFLEGLCLGEVCHMVQLAVGPRRLLGYRGGWLVPFEHSEARFKEECALTQTPTGTQGLPVASWEDVRDCLQKLLEPKPESNSSHGITISNVRRLFQSHFQLDLSVTALGHIRLLDVLKDPRLQDVCTLQSHVSGQFLVMKAHERRQHSPSVPPGVWGAFRVFSMPTDPPPALSLPLPQSSDCSAVLLSPGSSPRCGFWKACEDCSSTAPSEGSFDCNLSSLSSDETPRSLSHEVEESSFREEDSLNDAWQVEVKNTFIDVNRVEFERSGARQRSRSVPA